jgi:hypothetical protein
MLQVMQHDNRLRQLARWHWRRFHRAFWRLVLSQGLMVVFLILLLRSTAEDPHVNMVQSRKMLVALQPPAVADSENAAFDYRQAFKTFVSYSKMTGISGQIRKGQPRDPIELPNAPSAALEQPHIQAYLVANAAAFPLLEAAVQKVGCDWKTDYLNPFFASTDHLSGLRQAARLLILRARVRAHAGDQTGATRDLNAVRIVATHARRDHFLLNELVSLSIESMNFSALESIVMHDTPADIDVLDAYRAALGPILDPRDEILKTVETESAAGLFMLDWAALQDPRTLISLGGTVGPETETTPYRLIYGSDRKTLKGVYEELHGYVMWGELAALENELLRRNGNGPAPLAMTFSPSSARMQVAFLRCVETRRCADTALALLMFRIKHGRDAKTLEELVPEYLPMAPVDFFNHLPLRLRVDDQPLVVAHKPDPLKFPAGLVRVYSLGLNRKDDAGDNTWWCLTRTGLQTTADDPVFIIPPSQKK